MFSSWVEYKSVRQVLRIAREYILNTEPGSEGIAHGTGFANLEDGSVVQVDCAPVSRGGLLGKFRYRVCGESGIWGPWRYL